MKKIIIFLTAIAFIPTITFASIDSNLKYGMKGGDIQELQEFLIAKGFMVAEANTGNFYSLTLKAVKEFQSENKIPSTGYVGPITRAEINKQIESDTASSSEEEINSTIINIPIQEIIATTTEVITEIKPQVIRRHRTTKATVPVVTGTTENPLEIILETKGKFSGTIYRFAPATKASKNMAKQTCDINGEIFWTLTGTNDEILLGNDEGTNIDTTKYSNGSTTVTCKLEDTLGNTAQTSTVIDIEN